MLYRFSIKFTACVPVQAHAVALPLCEATTTRSEDECKGVALQSYIQQTSVVLSRQAGN